MRKLFARMGKAVMDFVVGPTPYERHCRIRREMAEVDAEVNARFRQMVETGAWRTWPPYVSPHDEVLSAYLGESPKPKCQWTQDEFAQLVDRLCQSHNLMKRGYRGHCYAKNRASVLDAYKQACECGEKR